MSEKFHRAAEDGYLNILKEATKRDCNHPDEDGTTPTACAAFAGKLEALRLLVGRGGDPEKCDYYGNTSLHCAAARGHLNCVSFLVNFGVNIWAMDNEFHTAKDLAAINNKEEILRYLDLESAKQEKEDPKSAKKLQEKAKKDAEKRQKEYDKIQKKADKKRKEEEEKLEKEREKINNLANANKDSQRKGIFSTISKNSLGLINSNKSTEPKVIHSKSVHTPIKFSELTQSSVSSNKKTIGGIQRKLLRKKINSENKTNSFKVRATILQVQGTESNGRKSVRNLSGLQRDSEIIFVPNGSMSSTDSGSPSAGKRGKISDVFLPEDYSDSFYSLIRSKSEPDFGDYKFGSQRASIFERPGFGSVAFRNSLTATLSAQGSLSEASELSRLSSDGNADTSLDSHGSPAGNRLTPWEEEDLPSDDEEEPSPVYLFLAANGLENYMPLFTKEHIDLEALMLLNDQDLESMKLPLGPRRKLLRALNDRRLTFEDPGEVTDIRL